MGISYLTLLILFSRQTEHSRTPSGISRVSLWSFLIQATMDSMSFAGHITFAILAEGRPSLSLIVPAFLACLVFVYETVRKVLPFLLLVIDPNEYTAIFRSYSSNTRTRKLYATSTSYSYPASYSNRQRHPTATSTNQLPTASRHSNTDDDSSASSYEQPLPNLLYFCCSAHPH
jgi:hypothetical protein